MYDTVCLRLSQADAGGVDFLEETAARLHSLAVHDYNGYPVATGRLDNLSISLTPRRLKVAGGSLARWYTGSNLHTLTRPEVQEAIEALGDALHLPMSRATVTRLDVGTHFLMSNPIPSYLSHLGTMKGATRLEQPGGLYYKARAGSLVFYDKAAEAKARGEPLPEQYQGGNILRYERRFTRPKSTLGTVTAATLYDRRFFGRAVTQWQTAFLSIHQTNDITANFSMIANKRQFYKLAALEMIRTQGGETAFLKLIDNARQSGRLTVKQAYTLKQAVREVCKEGGGLTQPSQEAAELAQKIAQAVQLYTQE